VTAIKSVEDEEAQQAKKYIARTCHDVRRSLRGWKLKRMTRRDLSNISHFSDARATDTWLEIAC